MDKMNWLDIVILIPIVYGLIHGLLRGFVRELTSVFSVVGGVVAAKLFAPQVADVLLSALNISPRAALIMAYALLFIGVALLCKLVAQLITKLLKKLDINWLNRLVGGVFGSVMWALIASLVLNLFIVIDPYYSFIKTEAKQESHLYEPILSLASVAKSQAEQYLPDVLPQTNQQEVDE